MAEIALVTARRNRLQKLADAGDRQAIAALRLSQEPTRFLSTVQIGITAIGVLNGIVGEAAFSGHMASFLYRLGVAESVAPVAATAFMVVLVTYLSIVLGELVPKRLAQNNAEALARIVAHPIDLISKLSRPFVWLLMVSTEALLKLVGTQSNPETTVSEDDIHALLEEGSQTGLIDRQEHEIVRNAFSLDDRTVSSIMTPRGEIAFLDLEEPLPTGTMEILDTGHLRFPVCRDGLNNVIGILDVSDLLKMTIESRLNDLENFVKPPIFIPESVTGMQLLQTFRESGSKMGFVVDEHGDIQGLVTPHNLLEAIAGEFMEDDPKEQWAVRREDGSWLLSGLIPIEELKNRLDLDDLPDEDEGRYHTLNGLIMWRNGRLPRLTDNMELDGWRLEVVDLDGNRIDKVIASRFPEPG